MRPRAIRWFEYLLLPALALDLINNVTAWHRVPNNPFEAPYWAELLICAIPSLIGLIFWYFISRRGSQFARWFFVILVTLASFGFVAMITERGTTNLAIVLAAFSELLKFGAMICLFVPDARAWFEKDAGPTP